MVILKVLGLPLKSIGKLLKSEPGSLRDVLEPQHKVLAEGRQELERTIEAIHVARTTLDTNHEPNWTDHSDHQEGWNAEGNGLDNKVLE